MHEDMEEFTAQVHAFYAKAPVARYLLERANDGCYLSWL
jgi:hypothetical protein